MVINSPTAQISGPALICRRGPVLAANAPEPADSNRRTTVIGRVEMPAASAPYPAEICRCSTSTNSNAPSAPYVMNVITLEPLNERLANSSSATTGCCVWRSTTTNTASSTRPPTTTDVGPAFQPSDPALVMPYVNAPSPVATSSVPGRSRRVWRCSDRLSGTYFSPSTMTAIANGTLMPNAHRHDTSCTSQPPRNGPIAVATPPRPDQAPTAAARSSWANAEEMIARLPGVNSAPPMPCKARAAISVSTLGDIAQSSDAAANHATPTRYTRRLPSRSPSDPPSRIRLASGNRYPFWIHCRAPNPASNSWPIRFVATFAIVLSRNAMPLPRIVTASTPRPSVVRSLIGALTRDSLPGHASVRSRRRLVRAQPVR